MAALVGDGYYMSFEDKIGFLKKEELESFKSFVAKNFFDKYILTDDKFLSWQYGFKERSSTLKGGDFSIAVIRDKGNIFGYLGIVPLKYKMGSKVIDFKIYVNLLVDPRVRSLGLGTLLMEFGMRQTEAAAVFGYNPQTVSIYKKLGSWEEMGDLNRYIAIYNADKVTGLLKEDRSLSDFLKDKQIKVDENINKEISFSYEKEFGNDFDQFWFLVRERYEITVERTSDYMNWRYTNHPHLSYKIIVGRVGRIIKGYVIFRFETVGKFKIARIIDMVVEQGMEKYFLGYFNKEVAEQGASMADFMLGGDYYREDLLDSGWFLSRESGMKNYPILFNPVHYGRTNINFMVYKKKKLSGNFFYKPNLWMVTKGDGDQDRPNPH